VGPQQHADSALQIASRLLKLKQLRFWTHTVCLKVDLVCSVHDRYLQNNSLRLARDIVQHHSSHYSITVRKLFMLTICLSSFIQHP